MLSISVIVPVLNDNAALQRCLGSITDSSRAVRECIVVDDGSSEPVRVPSAGFRVIRLEETQGPAHARNLGAQAAVGDVVFFIDADVVLHPDALDIGARILEQSPELAGVFGSYDDVPVHNTFVSQYRNLFHHWVHQHGKPEASSFWSGCGGLRREVFEASGGFDVRYSTPCIEDIELGARVIGAGHAIRLEKTMLCTHLKQWTLWQVIRTDLFRRGIPWVALLIRERQVPRNLNLDLRARLATLWAVLFSLLCAYFTLKGDFHALLPSAGLLAGSVLAGTLWSAGVGRDAVTGLVLLILMVVMVLLLGFSAGPIGWVPLLVLIGLVLVNFPLCRYLAGLRGITFATASISMQLVYFVSCALSVPLGALKFAVKAISEPVAR